MAKVPLKLTPDGLFATVHIRNKRHRIGYAEVPFLIDTGSTVTFISPYGALRLGISVDRMPPSTSIKIGGTSAQVHIMEDTDLYLRTDTADIVKITMTRLSTLFPPFRRGITRLE